MESGYTAARAAFCGPRCFRSPSPFKGRPVVSYPDMWPGPIRKPRLPGVSVFNKPQWIFYGPARPGSGKRLSREARERAVRVGERKIPGFRRSRALVLSCPVGTKHRNAWRVFVVVDRFFNMNEQRHFVCVCVRLCVWSHFVHWVNRNSHVNCKWNRKRALCASPAAGGLHCALLNVSYYVWKIDL